MIFFKRIVLLIVINLIIVAFFIQVSLHESSEVVVGESIKQVHPIYVIQPYFHEGVWVFDDKERGLEKEVLVDGIPEMIEVAVKEAKIKDPKTGFILIFSSGSMLKSKEVCLEWIEEKNNGNVYEWKEKEMKGWLCSALLKYYKFAPKQLYVIVTEKP